MFADLTCRGCKYVRIQNKQNSTDVRVFHRGSQESFTTGSERFLNAPKLSFDKQHNGRGSKYTRGRDKEHKQLLTI